MQYADAKEMLDWYASKFSKTCPKDFITPTALCLVLTTRSVSHQESGRRNLTLLALFKRLDTTQKLGLINRWWTEARTEEVKILEVKATTIIDASVLSNQTKASGEKKPWVKPELKTYKLVDDEKDKS